MTNKEAIQKASWAYIAGAGKAGKGYAIKPSDGSGDFSFSRPDGVNQTGVKNAIDPSGRLVSYPANVPAVNYELNPNLLLHTEDFNDIYWTKSNATITPNATISPNGVNSDADLFLDNSENNVHNVQSPAISFTAGDRYSVSFFAKKNTLSNVYIATSSELLFGPDVYTNFDLSEGTVAVTGSSEITAGILPHANGWYRCFASYEVQTNGSYSIRIGLATGSSEASAVYSGAGQGIYLWGAQLEKGSQPLKYHRNDSFRRFIPQGLWIEPEATNLFAPSNDLTALSWVKTGATISANSSLAPDGTMTADKLVEDTSTGVHRISYSFLDFPNAIVRAISFYVKPAGRTAINVVSSSPAIVLCRATFTLTGDGVATGEEAIGIEKAGDYYKCKVRADRVSNNPHSIHFSLSNGSSTSYTGDGSSGAFITDLQIEDGSVVTSTIKTEGATVTRPADVPTITNASELIGQEQGTIPIRVHARNYGTGRTIATIGTLADGIHIFQTGLTVSARFNSGGVERDTLTGTLQAGFNGIAVRYNGTAVALHVNGVEVDTGTATGWAPATMDEFSIGCDSDGANQYGDFIRIYQDFKQQLTIAEANSLSYE